MIGLIDILAKVPWGRVVREGTESDESGGARWVGIALFLFFYVAYRVWKWSRE
jgi:hypothetical protein